MQGQGLVIACGEFGSRVAAHLEVRGSAELGSLTWTGTASNRAAAALLVRSRLETFEAPAGTEIELVAAADEAVGSGILVAAAEALALRHPCRVWLALPQGGADRGALARAYAALMELAVLRRSGLPLTLILSEKRGDALEIAQRFGDAIVYKARRGVRHPAGSWACHGFSLGVVRDPVATVKRRLAQKLVVQAVEQFLRTPDPGHLLPGLGEALQRELRALLIPVESLPVFQQRWLGAGGGAGLEALMDHYAPGGDWHGQSQLLWDGIVDKVRAGIAAALGHAWRSGFATIYAEARGALDGAHRTLEGEIQRCEQAVKGLMEQFEMHQADAGIVETDLSDVDRLVATYLLESMRLNALERVALSIDGVVELVMDGLWAKSEKVRQLLEAVQIEGLPPTMARLAHGLGVVFSAEQERELLGLIEPRLVRKALHDSPSPAVQDLLEAARGDVDRHIRRSKLDLHLPRGHRIRTAWMAGVIPAVRLTDRQGFSYSCEVTPVLPASYREEIASLPAAVREESVPWFPDEWVVYSETPPFSMGRMLIVAEGAEAYRDSPEAAREGLHVLAEPVEGWPALDIQGEETGPEDDDHWGEMAAVQLRPARTALRGILLGLIRPDPETGESLSVHPPAGYGGSIPPIRNLSGLVHRLTTESDLAESLELESADLLHKLPPHWLAGYYALLRWFQTAILDGDRGLLERALHQAFCLAVETERRLAVETLMGIDDGWIREADRMISELGSERDRVSVASGPWRCLRSLEN